MMTASMHVHSHPMAWLLLLLVVVTHLGFLVMQDTKSGCGNNVFTTPGILSNKYVNSEHSVIVSIRTLVLQQCVGYQSDTEAEGNK